MKADSCEALISDYAALAQVLDLPEKDAKEQNLIVAAVRRWLENNSGWLLVFDNADEPRFLEDYIPLDQKGHILMTSRAQLFDNLGISKPVELEKMQPDDAREFLLKRTGRSDPPSFAKQTARQRRRRWRSTRRDARRSEGGLRILVFTHLTSCFKDYKSS